MIPLHQYGNYPGAAYHLYPLIFAGVLGKVGRRR